MALSKINTNSIADDAVTTAKVNPAQTDITSVGTLTSFASTGIDDNGDATTMTIDTSENIGIGNTSPSSQYMTRLVVGDGSGTEGITIYSGNDSSGRLEFSDATSGDGRYAGGIVYEHNNDALRFNTNGGNERMRIDSGGDIKVYAGDIYFNTSGKGIVLGATSNTDANTLDDYEEGTFTPSADSFSGTMTFETARYIKIGKLVHVNLKFTSDGNSDTSQISISGFPFSAVQEHPVSLSHNMAGNGALQSNTTPTIPNAMINTAEIMYVYLPTGGAFQYAFMGTGFIRVSGTYITT